MSDKINVMIVEDQAMPRQLFEAIVKSQQKFNLAVSIDNAAIADICCARHAIDLVLMDVVTKNGASGLVAAEKIKAQNKKVKIIIVTSMPECSYVERAKKIGVEGFWYKDFSVEPILTIIERALSGESVYPDDVPEIQSFRVYRQCRHCGHLLRKARYRPRADGRGNQKRGERACGGGKNKGAE